MAGKPLFHYDDARGRMESVRWLLAAAGVDYEEKFIHTNEDLEKLRSGLADLNEMFIEYPYDPPGVKEANIALMKEKAANRYFPAFEKVLKSHGQDFLVGNKLSKADIHLVEMIYNMEELDANIIANFPLLQRNQAIAAMAGKPVLHYFDGGGRMEPVRWLLAAAGVEFEEKFLKTRDDLARLRNDGSLMFQQVPMVEIDGMKLVQTRAILNYIASKYNLYGKDMKERALYDMFTLGNIWVPS
ncbi:Glutathione S-transferase A6 [Cricetulus griseus]|uniref:glutathione transferase n=1 Tax=Cricetulus griseus TaxID=10029 RepID=G3IFJ6_CRIGR|nr:Glutathione S-transferase A6 [Cricetulus griseus]